MRGKWKSLGDKALEAGNFALAGSCFEEAKDLAALLLLQTAVGDYQGLKRVAQMAKDTGKANIAVMCFLLMQDTKTCLDIFVECNRLPQAAFFARTYCPSEVPRVVA